MPSPGPVRLELPFGSSGPRSKHRAEIRKRASSAAAIGHRHWARPVVNGTAGHVLDYDDVQNILPGHATAPVAPAALALAERIGANGEALLLAFIVGFETTCRVGALDLARAIPAGLSRHDAGRRDRSGSGLREAAQPRYRATAGAIGLAATQASGLQAVFGSMAKCFNVGKAAQSGLLAAQLVARGFECTQNVLEAERGFAAVFADGGDAAAALGAPPDGWHLCRNLFKNYASCFMTHSPLEALIQLRARLRLDRDDVERLVLRVEQQFPQSGADTAAPSTGLEVKFNVQHCLALALAGYDTGAITTFSDTLAVREDLRALAEKCAVEIVPEMHFTAAEVDIQLKDGRRLVKRVDTGEPEPDIASVYPAHGRKGARASHRNIRYAKRGDRRSLHEDRDPAPRQRPPCGGHVMRIETLDCYLTSSHWGAFRAEVEGGRVVGVRPFEKDPDPSPIITSMPDGLYARSRVAEPMIRQGWLEHGPGGKREERGADAFVPVPWERALDLVAGELARVNERHGNAAIFAGSYGWSSAGRFHHARTQLHRFLNCHGGFSPRRSRTIPMRPRFRCCRTSSARLTIAWPSTVLGRHRAAHATDGVLRRVPLKNTQIDSGGVGSTTSAVWMKRCARPARASSTLRRRAMTPPIFWTPSGSVSNPTPTPRLCSAWRTPW